MTLFDNRIRPGNVPARVRDRLWERVGRSLRDGAATLIHSDDTEQGFSVRILGDPSRIMTDFDGLFLPKTPISR